MLVNFSPAHFVAGFAATVVPAAAHRAVSLADPGTASPWGLQTAQAAAMPSSEALPKTGPGRPSPTDLHPALWRAHQLGRPRDAVSSSGYPGLDAQLPGGGWPARVLTELLLPHAGVGELRLLAPVLGALQRQQRGVMWFDPPAAPCAGALAALGIDLRQLVIVQSRQTVTGAPRPTITSPAQRQRRWAFGPSKSAQADLEPRPSAPQGGSSKVAKPHLLEGRVNGAARSKLPAADILWALEQALKSGHLGAAVAWLPARLPCDALRRLQLAAQAHDGPVFLLRDVHERTRPSAAPLRLLLGSAGPDLLRVVLLKRRGPPLAGSLTLALTPVLSAPALARALRTAAPVQAALPQDLRPAFDGARS